MDLHKLEGENSTVALFKERVEKLAAAVFAACEHNVSFAVDAAMQIINEVDRKVDRELQTTPAREKL